MRKAPYMSKPEMINWLKLGVLAGETAAIADKTPEKDWHKKLKTCATYLENITLERLKCLDPAQLKSVIRRRDHTEIILSTENPDRLNRKDREKATVNVDDIEDLAELALDSCTRCDCSNTENCKFRLVMHRLDLPVVKELPGEGECEFKI